MAVQSVPRIRGPRWSRRLVLGAAAATAAGLVLPRTAGAQTDAAGEWQPIHTASAGPGPTLRLRRGEELRVRLINDANAPTAIHWHGVRVPNAMDGVPGLTQAPAAPGASFDYRFTPLDAGTFWYHPPVAADGQQGLGPSGALIVMETEPVAVDQDVLLFVDKIAADTPPRTIAVRANERIRLRIVNALADRLLPVQIEQHRVFVMAIDGQPAEPFPARDSRVTLAPGNRIDLFAATTLPPGSTTLIVAELPEGRLPLGRIVYDPGVPARAAPPADVTPLPANPLPSQMDFRGALRADISLDGGIVAPAGGRPLFSAKRGRAVMLALVNRTAAAHVVHVHGHAFRLLDSLDDGWKPFWLDTMLVSAGQTARIAFVVDNPGKWMLDGRMFGEKAAGRGAWFEVL